MIGILEIITMTMEAKPRNNRGKIDKKQKY